MKSPAIRSLVLFIIGLILLHSFARLGQSQSEPGTGNEKRDISVSSVVPIVTETGGVSLSVDGLGTLSITGTIQVEKPPGATVRKAFLAAASTGDSNRQLVDGDVKINGVDVSWDQETPSTIDSWNHWADVTSIVKPTIDAAAPGRVDFTISEVETLGIDGEILAVIFDDPNQTTDNTITLLFGAQDVNGDTFFIGLAEPIDTTNPNLILDMSLGISFGFQGSLQYSEVDVNGTRLTTSAGGQDDGDDANGALLTVGGLDDSNANPPDPFALPNFDPRIDDELYNLIPLVSNGDTGITVETLNPSEDDNILFAAFFLSTPAIVGEGILLSPLDATNPVNTPHTLSATLQDDLGNPIVNRDVTFTVVSGPHSGTTGVVQTDANGQASFTYTGTTQGLDLIQASFVNDLGVTLTSNTVTKSWEAPTAVTLLSFTATPQNDQILLEWETASEIDNEGFNLWRSTTASGGFVKINSALIPAQGNESTGHAYSYLDDDLGTAKTYYYKLEDVDLNGVSTFHGPVLAADKVFVVNLPLVLKN